MRTCHFCSITKVAKILLRVTFGCFKIFGGTQVNFSDPIPIHMLWDNCLIAVVVPNQLLLKGVLCTRFGSKRSLICRFSLPVLSSGLAMLISPNKGETAVHGCQCRGDMVVHMHKVLATLRSWHVCFRA